MAKSDTDYDIIIVGGGPGGLSAGLWCSELGLRSVIFEKESELGGQLLSIYNPISNYLGISTRNGIEMRDRFVEHTENYEFLRRLNSEVARIDFPSKTVFLSGGESYASRAIILATGVRRRRLGVEGEKEFAGRGVLESGQRDRELVKDKRLVIVGGGDAALENAVNLSGQVSKLVVMHRRNEFKARSEFVEKVLNDPKIEVLFESVVTRISGSEIVERVEIRDSTTGEIRSIPADAVLIRIGVQPNTELFRGSIDLDTNGYIVIRGNCETSAEGVFAIGDVASPESPTISAAVGMGSIASRMIFSNASR